MLSILKLNSKRFFSEVKNGLQLLIIKSFAIVIHFSSLRTKLKNLDKVNLELGLYHLKSGHMLDAIFRFYFAGKIFSSKNNEYYYWLGWCYLLLNRTNKAKYYFKLSTISSMELINYLDKFEVYESIPSEIYATYNMLIVKHYIDQFLNNRISLLYQFVKLILKEVKEISTNYHILELGCRDGALGEELHYHINKHYYLSGVEESKEIINYTTNANKSINQLYDRIYNSSIEDYLTHCDDTYNLVMSFNTLNFKKNLSKHFLLVFNVLSKNGVFALVLPLSNTTEVSKNKMFFLYQDIQIKEQLANCGFVLLTYLCITIKGITYGIFINKK